MLCPRRLPGRQVQRRAALGPACLPSDLLCDLSRCSSVTHSLHPSLGWKASLSSEAALVQKVLTRRTAEDLVEDSGMFDGRDKVHSVIALGTIKQEPLG